MNVSIFGLGYVGAVTGGCLTEAGHRVIGVDVHEAKVEAYGNGLSPIIEPELDALLANASKAGLLSATTDAYAAVQQSEISIISVGTPSQENGKLNLSYVRVVTQQIADAIEKKGHHHTVIFRSTMLPGSTRSLVDATLVNLGALGLVDVYYCPEFLREGTAVKDFRVPSLAVVGTWNGEAPGTTETLEILGRKPEIMTWEGAEMIKYACNAFHALKVSFANEVGRISKHVNVDGRRVMDVLCQDQRLNISRAYLKPGNPFGGSCLPKDVSALGSFARMEGLSLPLLDHTLATNNAHLDSLVRLVTRTDKRKVGILGLAFKADTDDLRGSPMVAVAETLLGRGYELLIYDPQLNLSRLIGANQADINRRMPHLAALLRSSAGEVVANSEIIVAAQRCAPLEELSIHAHADHFVIDVNDWPELESLPWRYEGICW
jgi:GDP-mannose 6-dehydrogenase